MPLFSGKARKECFSFHEKHIRDGFYVTFSLVRKSNQKVPQRSADLWTPGVRFKAVYRHAFYRNLIGSCLKQLSCFEPVRGGYFTAQGVASVFEKACSDLGGQ